MINKLLLPSNYVSLLFFVVGATMRIDIYLIGRFSLGELILIIIFPFSLRMFVMIFNNSYFRKFFNFMLLWILGVFISDILNNTEIEFFIRGLARPIILIVSLISYLQLFNKSPNSVYYFFSGLFFSGLINFIIPTDDRAIRYSVDYDPNDLAYSYYAYVYTPLFYGLASYLGFLLHKNYNKLTPLFLITIGIISLPLMSRTTGFNFIICGIIIMFIGFNSLSKNIFLNSFSFKRLYLLKFFLISIFSFVIVLNVYSITASSGLIGERHKEKYTSQTSAKFSQSPIGFLFTGRHYTLGSIFRIMDNPIFGAGSWPKQEDTMIRAQKLIGGEISERSYDINQREIGHSILFGIWAQNGILVIPLILFVLVKSIRLFIYSIYSDSSIKVLILPYLIVFLFSLFFNNFSSISRALMVLVPTMMYFNVYDKNNNSYLQ